MSKGTQLIMNPLGQMKTLLTTTGMKHIIHREKIIMDMLRRRQKVTTMSLTPPMLNLPRNMKIIMTEKKMSEGID